MSSHTFPPQTASDDFELTIPLGELQVAALLSSRVARLLNLASLSLRLYADSDGNCYQQDGTLIANHPSAAALIDSINILVQGNIQRAPWSEPPQELPLAVRSNNLFNQAANIIFTEYAFDTRQEAELTLMLYGYLTGKTTSQLGQDIVERYQTLQADGLLSFEEELQAHGRPPQRR